MIKSLFIAIMLLALPLPGQAWWNADWSYRKKITFDTTDAGAKLKENLTQVPIAVRLHGGNVTFADMKPDGTDVRFVAGDDKTPLKHHIESFDPATDMGIVWVQIPRLTAGATTEFIWLYYGNKKATKAEDTKGTYDTSQTLVLHLSEKEGAPKDQTAYAQNVQQSTAKLGAAGLLGGGATFDGNSKLVLAASPTLNIAAAGGFTFSAWVKIAEPQKNALIFSNEDGDKSLQIGIDQSAVFARVTGGAAKFEVPRADVGVGAWRHVTVVAGDKRLAVYVDGVEAASANGELPAIGGTVTVGAAADGSRGFKGDLDEVRLANAARSPDAVKAAFAAAGQDTKFSSFGEDEKAGGSGTSYFAILIDNLTVDAWIVIGILMVMLVISFVIMFLKTRFLFRVENANRAFLEQFERLSGDLTAMDTGGSGAKPNAFSHGAADPHLSRSPLFDLYRIGIQGLKHRFDLYREKGMPLNLTPQAVNSIRAGIDAGIVRENARLNSQMVLLTIAISGGPFLGLLGTVVGVMITFAAIAAAGDVNVNAIAPGIAAALLATVAGLAVAIPALFGYNWLASRIRDVSNEMHVFADELLSKLSENYSA